MARPNNSQPPEDDTPSFEASLSALEEIVEAMEHDKLPLENLVEYYEKGSLLLKRCEAILHSARGRIELITLRNQNEISQGSPNASADPELSSSRPDSLPDEDDDDDDNDIRLF